MPVVFGCSHTTLPTGASWVRSLKPGIVNSESVVIVEKAPLNAGYWFVHTAHHAVLYPIASEVVTRFSHWKVWVDTPCSLLDGSTVGTLSLLYLASGRVDRRPSLRSLRTTLQSPLLYLFSISRRLGIRKLLAVPPLHCM